MRFLSYFISVVSFFAILFFGFGCISSSSSPSPENTSLSVPISSWRNALFFDSQDRVQGFFSDRQDIFDLSSHIRPFTHLAFFPGQEEFIAVDENDASRDFSFFDVSLSSRDGGVDLDSRLLFSTRDRPMFLGISPLGGRFFVLFADAGQENKKESRCCRLAVYDLSWNALVHVSEDVTSADWLPSGDAIIFTQALKRQAFFLSLPASLALSRDGAFNATPQRISDHAEAFMLTSGKIFFAERSSEEEVSVSEYSLNTKQERFVRRFSFATSLAEPIFFETSPDRTKALLLGSQGGLITAALFDSQNPLLSRLILPESKFVLWYTNDEVLFLSSSGEGASLAFLSLSDRTSRSFPFSLQPDAFASSLVPTSPVSSLLNFFLERNSL